MKKLITSVTVCSLALCALASCGSGKSDGEGSGKGKGDALVGKWAMDGLESAGVDGGGIIFSADGKGSVYEDTSSLLYFEEEGLNVGGTTLVKDYITESGNTLTVDVMGQQMLVMSKIDVKDGYDGKYSLDGGLLYDSIVEGMKTQGNIDEADLDITIDFDGSHSEVVFNDLFTYETKGKKLIVSGFSGFLSGEGDQASAEFSVDGDTLTLKDSKSTETLKRVK